MRRFSGSLIIHNWWSLSAKFSTKTIASEFPGCLWSDDSLRPNCPRPSFRWLKLVAGALKRGGQIAPSYDQKEIGHQARVKGGFWKYCCFSGGCDIILNISCVYDYTIFNIQYIIFYLLIFIYRTTFIN